MQEKVNLIQAKSARRTESHICEDKKTYSLDDLFNMESALIEDNVYKMIMPIN